MKSTYDKIEDVFHEAIALGGGALAPHEFRFVVMPTGLNGREHVGQSESAIGRRLREMYELRRVTRKRRDRKNYVEYALVPRAKPEQAHGAAVQDESRSVAA